MRNPRAESAGYDGHRYLQTLSLGLLEHSLPQLASTVHPIASCSFQNLNCPFPLRRAAIVEWVGCESTLDTVGLFLAITRPVLAVIVGLIILGVGVLLGDPNTMLNARLKKPGVTANEITQVDVGHDRLGRGFLCAEGREECCLSGSF